jgi:glycosyltransferase involved in cell wall biosynthesis
MKVLIFHGYLLRGTGSNVYNANLAQALARAGHEVHLLCQDLEAASLPWIDGVGRWRSGELAVDETGIGRRGSGGSVTAYLPDIGGLLPVYVADAYEGFEARTFPELSEAQLDRYIAANVAAVGGVAARAGGVEAALSNHLVMGPLILARAGLSFAAKVHGSALSYTVIPNPRFLPHAREGMAAARTVLVGSRHTAESLWGTIADDSLPAKTRLGPPGVDIEAFSPLPPGEGAADELEALAASLDSGTGADGPSAGLGRDLELAARGIRAYAGAEGSRVIFVGKLIVSKGCDLLLAAWPLVVRENPGARLLLIGFGEYLGALERLWAALTGGDIAQAREIAAKGRLLEGGAELPLRYLDAFLADLPAGYLESAAAAAESLSLAGRLEYGEVAHVVRASDAMVVPSTFPEAFGMVAAEAAAAGALPVCANHSGLAEVAGALGDAMPGDLGRLTSFDLGPDAVRDIAARLNSWLALPEEDRSAARAALVETVRARWSWDRVATSVIAASGGHLEELEDVPSG